MQNIAEEYAKKHNLEIEYYIAAGDFGEAYATTCGKVIKVTSDKLEYVCAAKMVGKNHEYAVDIYAVDNTDGNLIILQEMLETSPENMCIDSIYYELADIAEEQGMPIHMLDLDDVEHEVSADAVKLQNDLWKAVSEIMSSGTLPNDMHSDNIGLKSNGNFGVFDQQDKTLDPNYEYDSYMQKLAIAQERDAKIEQGLLTKTEQSTTHREYSF